MTANVPRYRPEEYARRGDEIYDRTVRPALRPEHDNHFVAIDIESGNSEIDADDFAAAERLRVRCPAAQVWLARVGQPAAYRLGGRTEVGRPG